MNVEIGVKAIAYGIPAMMILGGMFLLLLDYRINESNVIMGGLFLIIFGGAICILEAILGVPHSRAHEELRD